MAGFIPPGDTVLQDAWAIFSHHLMYKHENEIPNELRREIHSVAGAMMTADIAFEAIRDKRDRYLQSVAESTEKKTLKEVAVNLDSLKEYLSHKFPGRQIEIDGIPNGLSQFLPILPNTTTLDL